MKVIIVGGGVAGICLAHQLEKRGIDFKIITRKENYSSKIAAGMINPIVFRKMLKSWKADELIPYLDTFYSEIETKINSKFYHHTPIRRLFSTPKEKLLWEEKRATDNSYLKFLSEPLSNKPNYTQAENGNGFVTGGGYISSVKFVEDNQHYFEQSENLIYEDFDYSKVEPNSKTYKGNSFDYILFAEGYKGTYNPYFNYLPLNHTKGEILEITSNEILEDEILNRKCFVLPTGNHNYRLGATFDWNTEDLSPTEDKKKELLEKYTAISTAKIEIVGHQTGIRPTVPDRRPLLGKHPKYPFMSVFNGLGTKGYMLAPYFSEHLINHVFEDAILHPELDIKRWRKWQYQG
ncbi:MAG: NAD(P)/FAD-dependent oxidoreductase [Lishizhenia sp.]